MQINWIEIFGMIGGTGAITGLITWFVTIKIQRKKEGALANQEVAKADQERANSLDKTGDIYKKLTEHLDEALDEMRKEVKEVREENHNLKTVAKERDKTIQSLQTEMKTLTEVVEQYKKKCKGCIL